MKAIILSAGQGTRLFPYTVVRPKCLVPVEGQRPILEIQLETLADCGVREAIVVVGHGAELVERFLHRNPVPGIRTRTLFNPFHTVSDSLISCSLAQQEMELADLRGVCVGVRDGENGFANFGLVGERVEGPRRDRLLEAAAVDLDQRHVDAVDRRSTHYSGDQHVTEP